jgi:PKD domain-containing protein
VAAASSAAMRRSVRAIGQSRVGNPPVAARLRLRSASRAAIVASMVKRRVLLPTLVAMFVLLGSGQALAAPTWLAGEQRDPAAGLSDPPDVAAGGAGDAAVAWAGSGGSVLVAYRPRGGPWGGAVELDPGGRLVDGPLVTARANAEFVAVWIVNTGESNVLRSATRSSNGDWTTETVPNSGFGEGLEALEGTADGSVTVVMRNDGPPSSFTMGQGSDQWGSPQTMPISGYDRFAFAPNGSTVGVRMTGCGDTFDCLEAIYRSPGAQGSWGDPEPVPSGGPNSSITGYAVEATRDSTYTVVWGEAPRTSEDPETLAVIQSSDRPTGSEGAWGSPSFVADLNGERATCTAGNCFDLAAGRDGSQVAAWQQTNARAPLMVAALRSPGGVWAAGSETIGDVGSSGAVPFAAVTLGLIPIVAWGGGADGAHTAHRDPASGAWNPETRSARPRGIAAGATTLADIAADGQGDALTAWTRFGSGVFSAGFDATPPRFTAFSLPVGGSAGGALPFSAAAEDNWSGPPTISWSFGDGGTATGASVSHTYAAGGNYLVTASASDGAGNVVGSGNVSQQSGSVGVAPAAPNCGTADTDKDGINNGCDTNNGAQRPKAFKTVNATVVSGDVFVKLPAGSGAARASARKPPKGFKRLLGAETIPVGATLDTAHGRVKVRSAADTKAKKLQSGQFFRGRFTIRQSRIKKRSKKLVTELRLTGSSFKKTCKPKAKASISAKKKKSKKRVRRLFGNAKGSFRTSGRNAAATVRGTRWSVQDRCDGTLVTVQRGRVEVRDKVKRKTVIVRTGHTYLARSR